MTQNLTAATGSTFDVQATSIFTVYIWCQSAGLAHGEFTFKDGNSSGISFSFTAHSWNYFNISLAGNVGRELELIHLSSSNGRPDIYFDNAFLGDLAPNPTPTPAPPTPTRAPVPTISINISPAVFDWLVWFLYIIIIAGFVVIGLVIAKAKNNNSRAVDRRAHPLYFTRKLDSMLKTLKTFKGNWGLEFAI